MKRAVTFIVLVSFLLSCVLPSQAVAQSLNLPAPGAMVLSTPAYMPVTIKGVKVHPENPLLFDFVLDTGKSGLKIDSSDFKAESQKLIKYFLAALTIKEGDLWVNLSPYEQDRMIPEELGKTELGRDMLAQDYILKQLTASLIYPEKELGQAFWDKVYAKAQEQFGTTDIPVDTFNKVWIVADKAKVLERNNGAYVVGAHLKVMLEEDYVALEQQTAVAQKSIEENKTHAVASQVVREIIIPEIEKEVNQGQNFASLRQIFYSMILASWYKVALKNALLNQVYSNKAKTGGVLSDDPAAKEKIYEQYLQAYKKGVFNYIKEDLDSDSRQPIPRKYFSGGLSPDLGITQVLDRAQQLLAGDDISAGGDLAMASVRMAGKDVSIDVISGQGNIFVPQNQKANFLERLFGKIAEKSSASLQSVRLKWAVAAFAALTGLPLAMQGAEVSQKELSQRAAQAIISLGDSRTKIAVSHLGQPGLEDVAFLYDKAVDAMALKAAGKQKAAEDVLDYFAGRINIPFAEVVRNADVNGVYGILKLLPNASNPRAVGLINAVDRTSTKREGQGTLEYYSTPGPMAFMIMSMLYVNSERYLPAAVKLGEALLVFQKDDGGILDGDRTPGDVYTEPHRDAMAAFAQLYKITKDPRWDVARKKAKAWFHEYAYNSKDAIIFQGISGNTPRKIFATDAYSWTMAGAEKDEFTPQQLADLTERMLRKSLVQTTLELPDGQTVTVNLVDFSDNSDPEVIRSRGANHPMGSVEWTAGVILSLQVNAVRFWETGDPQWQQKAKVYKVMAEKLSYQIIKSFYELDSLEGKSLISFYASGQNKETGHGWKTPMFYFKTDSGRVIRGGSSISAWAGLPFEGVNPFTQSNLRSAYNDIPLDDGAIAEATKWTQSIITKDRIYAERVSQVPDVSSVEIVAEAAQYNRKIFQAYEDGNYQKMLQLGEKVMANEEWVKLAHQEQMQKAREVGGLLDYPWGTPTSQARQAELAVWRYPLLNEVAPSMWGMAVANYKLGRNEEAKKWMRRIILEIPYHQIYAPDGPGYWNALVSWERNPGNSPLDAEMGVLYQQVLKDLKLASATPQNMRVKEMTAERPVEKRLSSPQTPAADVKTADKNIWGAGRRGEFASAQWGAKAKYVDFDSLVPLQEGQKLRITYTLRNGNGLGVQMVGENDSEGSEGDMVRLTGSAGNRKTIEVQVPSDRKMRRLALQYGAQAWGELEGGSFNAELTVHSVEIVTDKAQAVGGIDLNAQNMDLDVSKDGSGVEMEFDPAMLEEFQNGNFTGVEGIILKIVPIQSPLSILGLGTTANEGLLVKG